MLYVTKLVPVSGGYIKLEIGKSRFFLEPSFCIKAGFAVGCEISEEQLETIQFEALRLKIRQRAVYYISLRPHSRIELERKLKQKFREHELIAEALKVVEELGLIDDKLVSEFFTESLIRKRQGVNKIKAKLYEKGIKRDLIEESAERTQGDLREDYQEALKLEFAKKLLTLQKRNLPPEEIKPKLIRYLLSRGFNYSEIKDCFSADSTEFRDDENSTSEDF